MTLDDLIKIRDSLKECKPDVEDFSWGPTLSFAQKRREEALKMLNREIKNYKDINKDVRNQ